MTEEKNIFEGEMIDDKRLPLKKLVIAFLEKNPFYKHAAWSIGISKDALEDWRSKDEVFASRCEAARAVALNKFVNRSSPDFILTHADPETFNIAKKVDVTSAGEAIKSNTIVLTNFKDGTESK